MTIHIPPLRERLEDLPLLIEHFVQKYNREYCSNVIGVSEEVLKRFQQYSWPGNVRELDAKIRRAFILGCTESQNEQH